MGMQCAERLPKTIEFCPKAGRTGEPGRQLRVPARPGIDGELW
jgi:hypothetical protein